MIQIGALPTLDDAISGNFNLPQLQQPSIDPMGQIQNLFAQMAQPTTGSTAGMSTPTANQGVASKPPQTQPLLSNKDPRNFDMGGHHTLHTITDTALKAWVGGGFGGGLGGLGDTVGDVARGTAGTGASSITEASGGKGGGGSLLGSFLGGGGGKGKGKDKNAPLSNPSTQQSQQQQSSIGASILQATIPKPILALLNYMQPTDGSDNGGLV